jgi:uncharacterized RDD family membrane protein YckC
MSTEPVLPTAADTTQFLAIPPAARPYQGRGAGIVSRILANIVDLIFVIVLLAVLYLAASGVLFIINPAGFRFPIPPRWLGFTAAGVALVGYFGISWSTTGRTYGDQVLGLRVVNRRGLRLHPVMAFVRAVFCTVFMVGILWVAVSSRRRSIQDVVLRTSVIYDWIPDSVADVASGRATGNGADHPDRARRPAGHPAQDDRSPG